MRAFFFWEAGAGGLALQDKCNPYGPLLAHDLAKLDIHLQLGDYAFQRDWLEASRDDYSVLHLNWLHWFYRCETLEESVSRLNTFADNLHYAKELGYRVVWTLHNRYPHERPFPDLDHLARLVVARLADGMIAHCHYGAGLARKLFFRNDDLHVIPHGHYIDIFPNVISRDEARRRLGLPEDAFVYLFFGNARVYKGIENLIDAYRECAGSDTRLAIMTRRAYDGSHADRVIGMTEEDDRIHVFTHTFFPNEDFQIYLNAADVVVLPFTQVLTSGSAIAALSFGKPVIVPALGCLPELVDESMGILYDPRDAGALSHALLDIRRRDLDKAGRAAFEGAKSLDWHSIASRVAEVYGHRRVA